MKKPAKKPESIKQEMPRLPFVFRSLESLVSPVMVSYLQRLEREKQAARKLDPRDLANPPHKPRKFDINL